MASRESVKHVVADSGAFIRNAPLQAIGDNVYSIPDVVKEIKDKATLQRLQVLPYRLQLKIPSPDAIKFVTEFSKKTGDYRSLSAVDIQVMALTYQLEKENVGVDHIKSAPSRQVQWTASKKMLEKPTDIAGFYLSKTQQPSRTTSECTVTSDLSESHDLGGQSEKVKQHSGELNSHVMGSDNNKSNSNNENIVCGNDNPELFVVESEVTEQITKSNDSGTVMADTHDTELNSSSDISCCREGATIPSDLLEEDDSEEDDDEDEGIEEDDDEDDDDDGWITPSNIKSVKEKMGDVNTEKATVMVGCVTTDFAMQNVLIQMGLNVISVDGMLIRRAKSYVQRCFACMKITMNMTKEFCPHCGNNTLKKVSMTVEEDGSIRYFLSCRRPMNTRGLKYSLPLPKGGKHADNPVLVEDQPAPQQRVARKSRQKMGVFDPDYIAGQSPFSVTDITSRAAQLGIKSGRKNNFNKRNPNEVRKNYGRRK